MKEKEVSGAAQELKGKVEKEVGKLTGNKRTQAHGEVEEMKGKVKKQVGKVAGKAEKIKGEAQEKTR